MNQFHPSTPNKEDNEDGGGGGGEDDEDGDEDDMAIRVGTDEGY